MTTISTSLVGRYRFVANEPKTSGWRDGQVRGNVKTKNQEKLTMANLSVGKDTRDGVRDS
jgi:hypothetical protein